MKRKLPRIFWPALGLFLTLLLAGLLTGGGFFHLQVKEGRLYGSLVDVANRAAPVMLLSLGMTLVLATEGVDLSVGAICAIAGATAATLFRHLSLGPGIFLALALSLLCGLWNGLLVGWLRIQPIVATLTLMVAGRGVAQLITDGQVVPVDLPAFRFLGSGFFLGLPFSVTLVLLCFVVLKVFARQSAAGLFIESVGNNPVASHYTGLPVEGIKTMVYLVSGLFSGIAGLLITADVGAADANNTGLYLELDAILAVVIGGTSLAGGRFYLGGSILGALTIQTVTTLVNTRGVPAEWTLVLKAVVVLGICLLQSPRFAARFRRMGAPT